MDDHLSHYDVCADIFLEIHPAAVYFVFCIGMGLWTLCYYNVVLFFSIPLYSVSLIEYLSPLPLIGYMWEDVKRVKIRRMQWLYWMLLTVQVMAAAVMIGLHAKDIVHCAATLKYMQALIIF